MLANKTILITGAAGGLGEGIARVCHRGGAHVAISDIHGERASKVAKDLGDRAAAFRCDVRKHEDLSRLVAQVLERFGKIDGLVNNAGLNFVKPFFDTSVEEWEKVMSVAPRAGF